MERWVLYALLSMFFAGVTAVIAKQGLTGISGELGLAVRNLFVFVFVLLFAALATRPSEWRLLGRDNLTWLGVSAATTTASWIFYYKALKEGKVSTVAVIDKGSFVVAVVLAWLLLGEKITGRVMLGGSLILAGLLIVVTR